MERSDNFESRRRHLRDMTDGQLHARFWHLVEQIVEPLVEEAHTHTSPSIERSVLLRMGFSSIEAKALVDRIMEKGLLGHGAGGLVLRLAEAKGFSVREAGEGLLSDRYWDELDVS